MCCCTSKFKWFHTAIFIWNPWVSTPEFEWVLSLQAKPICILKVYDIRCSFHALSTLWRQAGKEHYPTVSSSFVLVLNSWFIPWLRVVAGARVLIWMLLETGSFNIGIASFHVTTCFILSLASLTISYGKRLIWNTRKIWNETFETNWAIRPLVVLVFTLINVPVWRSINANSSNV